MEKSIYKSKTIWGIGVVTVIGVLTQTGIVEPSNLTNVLSTLGLGTTVWGIRDVLD